MLQKNFTKPINIENPEDKAKFIKEYNFDSPEAIDWENLEVVAG